MPGDGHSYRPDITADGRFVAFTTYAPNLGGDGTFESRIALRDRRAHRTVTMGHDDANCDAARVADDGNHVLFLCDQPGEPSQVWLHDRAGGATELVSRVGETPGDDESFPGAISGDGRVVAFISTARNLAPDAPSGTSVHVHDRRTRKAAVIPRPQGVDYVRGLSMSGDGRTIAYTASREYRDGLPAALQRRLAVTILHDVRTGRSRRVGRGILGNLPRDRTDLSRTGRFVVFVRDDPLRVLWYDRRARRTLRVASSADEPAISADGRWVAYSRKPERDSSRAGVYLRRMPAGRPRFVAPQQKNASVAARGRFVAVDGAMRGDEWNQVRVMR